MVVVERCSIKHLSCQGRGDVRRRVVVTETVYIGHAVESDFRKKSCMCVMKTFAIFLLSKETFTIRTCSILEKFLSQVTLPLPMPSSALDELRPAEPELLVSAVILN